MPLWSVPVALWGYCAQRRRAGPATSPCSNVCTSLQPGKRVLHVLDDARWHPQRYPVELESSLVCAIDHLQPALAFAVTLLLRDGCWPSLENNVTYFGFEIPVNLLLSFALYWDLWGFPVWRAFLQCSLCLYCHRSFWLMHHLHAKFLPLENDILRKKGRCKINLGYRMSQADLVRVSLFMFNPIGVRSPACSLHPIRKIWK